MAGTERALAIVNVDGGTSGSFEAVVANIADYANNGEQAKVSIHVSELNGAAERILAGPTIVRGRLADEGDVRRIDGVAIVKQATLQKRNVENFEEAARSDNVIRVTQIGFVAKKAFKPGGEFREKSLILLKIPGDGASNQILCVRRKLPGIHEYKRAIGIAHAGERQVICAANFRDPGDQAELPQDLVEKFDAREFSGIVGQAHVHRDDVFCAETGVDGKNPQETS